jgi:predicted  nucleic acid-binding Zn-ribbon protein
MKGISDLLDSDVEDSRDMLGENSILSTSTEGVVPEKKTGQAKKTTRKRKCVTMPKPKARVAKSSAHAKKPVIKKTAATKRKALEEQVNGATNEELESEEEIQETQPAKPRALQTAATSKATKAAIMEEDDMEIEPSPAFARSSHAASRPTKAAPKVTSKPATSAKTTKAASKVTKQAIQDIVPSDSEMDDVQLIEPLKPRNTSRPPSRVRQESIFRRRAGSASDTERGDPNLRRKLGDVTRRFENIDLKYRNLKETGIVEANNNMEKLRRQCEATTQASNDLIASLKKELAMQGPLAQDARKLKKQIQTHDTEAAQLRKNTEDLSAALSAAQNEIKTLQAKLAAARSSSVAAEGSRTPARDTKATATSKSAVINTSEAVIQAQLKEELYSDLTGLIVRSVKRSEDGDTYDCIQTGRNGSKYQV